MSQSIGNVLGGRDHAVVIGASFAGMLCARVLADSFASVTIIERDALPETPESRKGVAQSNQTHALGDKGARVIEELFPGFWAEMTAQGLPGQELYDLARSSLAEAKAAGK